MALVASAGPAGASGPSEGDVLARWRGGELTTAEFLAHQADGPRLLESGGEELLVEVCKSAYLEIYYPQARALGLDRDGELLARFAGWEERNLAELYRRWHRPNPLPVVTPEAVKAHYERNPEQFTFGATVDLEVLFVRCEGSEKAWQVCRERMRSHQSRAGQGESLKTLLVEERERSGEANGSFAEIAPARLFPGLRAAVEDAEPGTFTNLVESAEGIFWVRVLARRDENVLPLERVERRIRRELTAELYDGWSQEEIDRLRSLRAESSTNNLAEDALFAQAARREGLAREPSFLKQRDTFWRWQLADAAFFRDLEVFPADEELASDRGVQLYREQVYLLATFHETGDSETTGKVSDKVAAGLAVANDPAAFLRAEAARYPNAIVETVGPLTRRELRRLDAELHDRSAELAPGQWTGPFRRSTDREAEAFLLLTSSRMPSPEEARPELLRAFRGRIGGNVDLFLSTFERRWELEVLLPLREGRARGADRRATP